MLEYKMEIKSVEGMRGHVTLAVPSMKERLKLLKESGLTGKAEDASLDTLIDMMDNVSVFVKSIDLKYEQYEFKDIESLGYYDFGMAAYNEIAGVILNGIPAGKK